MKKADRELIGWLRRGATAVQKFRDDDDLPVYFNDYDRYEEGVMVVLLPGCKFTLYNRTYHSFEVHCWMTEGTTLAIHHHPDYTELFDVKKGVLHDLKNDIVINTNESHLYEREISHTIHCLEDSYMIIYCNR